MEDIFRTVYVESKDFDDVVMIVESKMDFGAALVSFQRLFCKVLAHLLHEKYHLEYKLIAPSCTQNKIKL